MTSRLALRGTTFNIPSNRNLWRSLGGYDSLVEYQEVASRLMLAAYDPTKETFREYLKKASHATGVYLNDITLQNYRETQYQGYLFFPNASFDAFLHDFINDVQILIDSTFTESKIDGCLFDKVCDALSNLGIILSIDQNKLKLYHYYRLLRNDMAHHLKNDYASEYNAIDKKAIHSFYPTLAEPQPKATLSFDDFILSTANIKNIADEMTRSLLPHIDWVKLVLEKKDKWLPNYQKFIIQNRIERLKKHINTRLFMLYGITLSNYDIDEIVSNL